MCLRSLNVLSERDASIPRIDPLPNVTSVIDGTVRISCKAEATLPFGVFWVRGDSDTNKSIEVCFYFDIASDAVNEKVLNSSQGEHPQSL